MRTVVVFLFIVIPSFVFSQDIAYNSIIASCKKEFLYELYSNCGDKLISFKEIGMTDSSKIVLTENILKEDLSVANYGNLIYQIRKNCDGSRYSINTCFLILNDDAYADFQEIQGSINSIAPLYYKLFRKSNLIICLYASIHPDLIHDYIDFVDEPFMDKIVAIIHK